MEDHNHDRRDRLRGMSCEEEDIKKQKSTEGKNHHSERELGRATGRARFDMYIFEMQNSNLEDHIHDQKLDAQPHEQQAKDHNHDGPGTTLTDATGHTGRGCEEKTLSK